MRVYPISKGNTCVSYNIFFTIFLVSGQMLDFEEQNTRTAPVIGDFFYQLINEYYSMIWVASVMSNVESSAAHDKVILDFMKQGFYSKS